MSPSQNWTLLEWDTHFFGFRIARILHPIQSDSAFENVLAELRHQAVKMAYYSIPVDDQLSADVALRFQLKLVDIKTLYAHTLLHQLQHSFDPRVTFFGQDGPIDSLYHVALQAGEYSRFNVDNRFGRPHYEALYKLWIEKSVSREIAKEILVIEEKGKILGLVTVGEKNGCGDIGLVAVDESARGKRIGVSLLESALAWFSSKGYPKAQVVTQGKNEIACRIYEKVGFVVESQELFYHVWL